MKFKYKNDINTFKTFNLVYTVIANKKEFIKNPNKKTYKYTNDLIKFSIIDIVILIFTIILTTINKNQLFIEFMTNAIAIFTGIIFIATYIFIVNYFNFKKNNSGKYILIEKDGITDICKDSSIKFNWNIIQNIIIKDDLIIILADHPVIIYAKVEEINKLKKEINKICK
ncbi:MAG: hypothetical protein E7162_00410 [Firmicutes bacterium]|nr:hypothetical protein [Bacillota bacterium]